MINPVTTAPNIKNYQVVDKKQQKSVEATAAAIDKTSHVTERRQGDRRKNKNVKHLMDRRMVSDRRASQYDIQV